MGNWLLYAVVIALLAAMVSLPFFFENWVVWAILLGLLATFFFLYLLARRALVDFKRGMREGQRRN